jgi:tRNA G18 (ribose-2'-O)-methylase SpoU
MFFDQLLKVSILLLLVCKSDSFSNVLNGKGPAGRFKTSLWAADSENNDMVHPQTDAPKCYVVLSNIQSGSNVGSICRNALAFNVDEVIVVGRRNFRDKMRQADRGAKVRQKFVHFNSVAEAQTYLKVVRLSQ